METESSPALVKALLLNPRTFSLALGAAVACGVIVASVVTSSFEFGNGDLVAGFSPAMSYLVMFGIVVAIMAIGAGVVAMIAGWLVGVKLTAVAAFGLMLISVILSYVTSKPMARFRGLVWPEAPATMGIQTHRMYRSFGDGTTYTFVIAAEPQTVAELCRAANLSKQPGGSPRNAETRLYFEDTAFPPDTEIFQGDRIQLAYIPSENKAFVVRWPPPLRSESSSASPDPTR